MTPEPITDAALARYVAGRSSPAEERRVESWLAQGAANRAHLDELRRIWGARDAEPLWDVDAMWRGVRQTLDAACDHSDGVAPAGDPAARARGAWKPRIRGPVPLRSRRRGWLTAGAVAAATLAVVLVRPAFQPEPTGTAPAFHDYVTQRGQQATLQLNDGSKLVLAAASRVRVPDAFGPDARELFLEGEAVIDVVHDATRPFRIYARNAVIEDIGTRFSVRAYPEDSLVTVAVAEGIVALAQAPEPVAAMARRADGEHAEGVILHEGQVGTLASGGRVSSANDPAIERRFAWTEGRLEFEDTRLDEVLRTIGRWYDVDLRVEGQRQSSRLITASFSIASVEEMVHALSLAVDAQVKRSNGVITLRSRR